MHPLFTYTKKEFLEQARTGRLLLLTILFVLFGIMNPAIAKLTPWLMEHMGSQLAQSGMTIRAVEVTALTSWAQYFKNMPMTLLVFLILFHNILTAECQNGTLVMIITKGLKRWNVPAAKMILMTVIWTCGCLLSYGITYVYNAYFWDNNGISHIFFAAFCIYLYGLWLISVVLPASAVFSSGTGAMLSAGGAFLAAYLIGLVPAIKKYSPACLLRAADLLSGSGAASDYSAAIAAAGLLCAGNIVCAVFLFNRKQI